MRDRTDALADLLQHGGNLAAARRAFPDAPEPWIDLSTGINPIPFPLPSFPPAIWSRLPEAADVAALEDAAADTYDAADDAALVAVPGTQSALQILPLLIPARRVAILGFTYGEHARVWSAAGAEIVTVSEPEALADADVGIVVNPNNPDGRLIDPARLATIAATMAARGGWLIVDEAFADVMEPEATLIPGRPHGAIVLRSFGKAWGLAGVRLGFVIADADLVAAIRAMLGPWAVSGPAIAAGRAAFADPDWLTAARTRLEADALRLDGLLSGAGFAIAGGTPLFRLGSHPRAASRFQTLGRQGILVRAFSGLSGRLRFGLPADETGWQRLAGALQNL